MATIQGIYVALFGRPADPAGLTYFNTVTKNGADLSAIGNLTGSAEYLDRFKGFANSEIVSTIYQNLFARDGEKAGLDYWIGRLTDGSITVQNLAIAMMDAAQGSDGATVANKIQAADLFTKSLDTPAEIAAYSGIAATKEISDYLKTVTSSNPPDASKIEHIVTGLTPPVDSGEPSITHVALTTAVDDLKTGSIGYTAFDGTLGGVSPTINAGDTLVGTGMKNSLNITDTDVGHDITLPTINLSGIQTVNVTSTEGLTLDGTTWTGLQALNFTSSNGNDHIHAADTAALTITDTADDAVYAYGGKTVTVNNNSTHGSNGNRVEVQGGATTASVTINDGYDEKNYVYDMNQGTGSTNTITSFTTTNQVDYHSYIYSDALTQLNITGDSYHYIYVYALAGTRTLNVALDNNGTWFLQDLTATSIAFATSGIASKNFYLSAPAATSLTFNDAVDLSFADGAVFGSGQLDGANVALVSINGAGAFTADFSRILSTAAVDAHGSSGAITVELIRSGAQSFTGGSGRDIVSIGAGQTGTVTGGAGNNEIILDSIATADITTALGNLQSHVTGFSTLGVSGAASGTYGYDMTGLTAYTAFDVRTSGANVSFLHAHGSSLTIEASAAAQAITLATDDHTASSDVATLTLGNADTSGITVGTVVLEDTTGASIGTINIVSNGTGVNTIGTLSDSDQNIRTINLSGTAGVDLHQTALPYVTVSGSADNADNNISVIYNSSVSLGNGNNTVHTDSGTTTVTLGNGNNQVRADFGTNTIVLGDGNNQVTTYVANGTVTLGTGQNTVTAGTGTTTINLAASHTGGNDTIIVSATGSLSPSTTIAHMLAGDHLKIADTAIFHTTAITAVQVADATLLSSWVDAALSTAGGVLAQHEAGWFQFHGDTYVVEQAEVAGTAFTWTDTLVKLTGLIDLSTSHYDGASSTIVL